MVFMWQFDTSCDKEKQTLLNMIDMYKKSGAKVDAFESLGRLLRSSWRSFLRSEIGLPTNSNLLIPNFQMTMAWSSKKQNRNPFYSCNELGTHPAMRFIVTVDGTEKARWRREFSFQWNNHFPQWNHMKQVKPREGKYSTFSRGAELSRLRMSRTLCKSEKTHSCAWYLLKAVHLVPLGHTQRGGRTCLFFFENAQHRLLNHGLHAMECATTGTAGHLRIWTKKSYSPSDVRSIQRVAQIFQLDGLQVTRQLWWPLEDWNHPVRAEDTDQSGPNGTAGQSSSQAASCPESLGRASATWEWSFPWSMLDHFPTVKWIPEMNIWLVFRILAQEWQSFIHPTYNQPV